jgi:hypothetical protein
MNFRNARYNAFGLIDCEIDHPQHGWMPFTASPKDVESLGRDIFESAKFSASDYVPSPLTPPTAEQVRIERNRLLLESDWTQATDAPVDQAAWATYRQALRDVPQQAGFPESVDWPLKP